MVEWVREHNEFGDIEDSKVDKYFYLYIPHFYFSKKRTGGKCMPYISLKLVEGRSIEKKRELVSSVTKAVCDSLEITPDNVRIELIELKADLFSIAGELVSDRDQVKAK